MLIRCQLKTALIEIIIVVTFFQNVFTADYDSTKTGANSMDLYYVQHAIEGQILSTKVTKDANIYRYSRQGELYLFEM